MSPFLIFASASEIMITINLYSNADDLFFKSFLNSNIITHHAEDGSGVGSAIIAGTCLFFSSLFLIPSSLLYLLFTAGTLDWYDFFAAMTKIRKDKNIYPNV